MPLGWIDFSKSERNKVLGVLDLLSTPGTLDELGIAPVRDGFADLFFPGTSTIQTRAKYFLIVPYALKEIERGKEDEPGWARRAFDETERRCAETLISAGKNTEGIIGARSLSQGRWVKRPPSDVYWAGLRKYGIFLDGRLTLPEYIRAVCAMKKQRSALAQAGNRSDQAEENERDDDRAGELFYRQFWRIPTYRSDWMQRLDIRLTAEEGAFLKEQIIASCPGSILAYILEHNLSEALACGSFEDLGALIGRFPEEIQNDYALAVSFSHFLYVLRVLYNVIVSEGENRKANEEWERLGPDLPLYAGVNLNGVLDRLSLRKNGSMLSFLCNAKTLMAAGDVEGMKKEIKRRERKLKSDRAKTQHPGEYDASAWFGGRQLDYRFGNAKVLIRDIFESEGSAC